MSITADYVNNEAIFSFTSETAYTLPSYNSRDSITLKNLSAAGLTLTAFSGQTIDGASTYVLRGNSTAKIVRGESGWVVAEGSENPEPATVPTIVPAAGGLWQLATAGTDSACTNGVTYFVELNVPYNKTLTGVAYQVGSVGGTDKVIATLYSSAGAVLANSAVAGATVGTAAEIQSVAFESTYAAVAGRYYVGLTFNGTTAKFRTYPIPGSLFIAGSEAETFGTVTAITPGSTFAADKGPLCYAY